jgi:uncharacterized membrane protein
MLNDFYIIFYWWFILFAFGFVGLPLTVKLFSKFFDFGYLFSKTISILFLSYFTWALGSLKILPFSIITLWVLFFSYVFINILIVKKSKLPSMRNKLPVLLIEEIIFALCLFFWSYVRGFQPDVEGLEKFMDFGFINSLLRSQYFPPLDMWFAGNTINYYYFGHLVAAVLTKMSQLEPSIVYNLMIATIFAFAFTGTFSLTANLIFSLKKNLKMSFLGGLFSAFLLSLTANLQPLWYFLTHHFNFTGYWYPDATRFIVELFGAHDNTIHEFPIYSFVVSDLHGHVSDIPFTLLFLALLFSFLISFKTKKSLTINHLSFIIPLALIAAIMYMTNSWDFPIYSLIMGLIVLWLNYLKSGISLNTIKNTFIFTSSYFLLSIIFSLPFHLHFSQIAQGVGLVHAQSPLWQLMVLWGYQWTIVLGFFIFLYLCRKFKKPLFFADYLIIVFTLVATLLIVIPEFIYIKDIYIASYHRANTMFKLVYQSFMLYALSAGYIFIRLFSSAKNNFLKICVVVFFALLTIFPLYYPFKAIPSYYGDFKNYRGLYGLNFLQKSSPSDYNAVLWLQKNIKGQPVVLEAAGDSYTLYNRVSAMTGLPTIEGWLVHEWLWRGSYDEPGKRNEEVKTIFETKDLNLTKSLLSKYQVAYVFIGDKERDKYKLNESKFSKIGSIAYQSGTTTLYKID